MKIIMGFPSRNGQHGRLTKAAFTLVELLLTVVLLLLLLGAVVFNYSSLSRGARLDLGAEQLETLFRFARSQAASTGRQVRIVFENPSSEGRSETKQAPSGRENGPPNNSGGGVSSISNGTNAPVTVVWEPDPYGAPGQFVPLAEAQSYLDDLLELIEVVEVRLPGFKRPAAAVSWNGYSAVATNAIPNVGSPSSDSAVPSDGTTVEPTGAPVQVAFYPDGSSDSFEVIIGSQEAEDTRRLLLSLAGVTGRVQLKTLDTDADGRPVEDTASGERADAQGWAPGIPNPASKSIPTSVPVSP